MPPKGKAAKAGKAGKAGAKDAAAKMMTGPPPKPKKIPPPPACFLPDDIARFKAMFKLFDEDNIDAVKIINLPLMLRKLGFNPKQAEIKELYTLFLEDEYVDMMEFHEFLFMIEQKMKWGDDFETVITESMAILGQDEEERKIINIELLREELFNWGEPLVDEEFVDWIKVATKNKTLDPLTGDFAYEKYIELMNAKDAAMRFVKEPVNFFKLDQKTLAAMAIAKAEEEKAEIEKKEAEKKAREEAKRARMIAEGLIIPD